jgi:NAD-dependent dihydropyrimidine dehydrogenase PreA subunit
MAGKFRLMDGCPGAANLRTPSLAIKRCPRCGEEIEIFSNEVSAACGKCGLIVYNDQASCIECGKCEFACPVDEAKRGDLKGECYLCGRCTEVCPVAGTITYRRGGGPGGQDPGKPEAVSTAGGAE